MGVETKVKSIVDILQKQVYDTPNKTAYKYLINGEEEQSFTYFELDLQARKIAKTLRVQNVKQNDRALMIYPPGLDFIAAFLGCLYAGVIAVPAVPPNKHIHRLLSIVQDCNPSIILSKEKTKKGMQKRLEQDPLFAQLPWLATDEDLENAISDIELGKNDLAFLQYTSGSTSNPKGVIVTNQNLIHNSKMIQQAANNHIDSIFINWLPLHHDMGIIGGIIQPLFVGATCYSMSPIEFLQKPVNWLRMISKYEGTYSGAPNFAYDLCSQKVTNEEIEALDLSTWEIAFNGSDFVRYSTLHNFVNTFNRCGFRAEAFCPAYGLAEATLMVTVDDPSKKTNISDEKADGIKSVYNSYSSHEKEVRKVSCGKPHPDLTLKIIDPQTFEECNELEIGEIWIAGESVANGYWNNDEKTNEVFNAFTNKAEGPFLRTGDLGYVKNGELYFKERMKDIIIIRGKNHYPQDIELTVENSHYSIINFATAAFSVMIEEEEKLVLVVEIYRKISDMIDLADLRKVINAAIIESHEVQVHDIVFLKEGAIPKTSSGKVQRSKCKQSYLDQVLKEVLC